MRLRSQAEAVARVKLPNGWIPRDYQLPLWSYLENGGKRALAVWHRRAGKDDVALHWTCVAAHERVGNYWHCLPEFEQGRKAIWTAVNPHTGKRRIDEAFPKELRKKTDDHLMFIEFKNGSTWQVIGSDRYDSQVGSSPAGIVFSEWALANPSAFAYFRPILVENDGWAVFISTPRGRNHMHAQYASWKKRMAEGEDSFAEILDVTKTKRLTKAQLDEALQDLIDLYGVDFGKALFEQEYYCNFNAAILGAFYGHEMAIVRKSNRIVPLNAIPGVPVHTAWDIGVRDDTSIWWFQILPGLNKVLLLDCYTNSGGGIDHYAEEDRQRRLKYRWKRTKATIDWVPHDAEVAEWGTTGARTRLESMQREGLNPQFVPYVSKLDGINAARITLKTCIFHPRCEEIGIAALEQYRREWDDKKKNFKATEYKDWSCHLADAFRYLSLAWRKPAPKHETPKEQLPTGATMVGPPQPRRGDKIKIGRRSRVVVWRRHGNRRARRCRRAA